VSEEKPKVLETIVEGEIGMVRPWSKGNGFFLCLKGDSNDYYKFGKKLPNEGDKVRLKVRPGTGIFSEKIEVTEITEKPITLAEIKQTKKDADEIVEKSTMPGDKFFFKKENLIIRQTCIKAAAAAAAALVRQGIIKGKVDAADAQIYIADKLYGYVTEQEEPEQEEPEA